MRTTLLIVGLCLGPTDVMAAECFLPLTDPDSSNPKNWQDLVAFKPGSTKAAGVKSIQSIGSGYGDKINLDFYELKMGRHPSLSLEAFFQETRKHFPDFANSLDKTRIERFEPYSDKADDQIAVKNKEKWESENPLGAVYTFVLENPPAFKKMSEGMIRLLREHGDVLATCASSTSLVFSTVTTERGAEHPVSGNRGFGMKANSDGTWSFYSKGADRAESMTYVTLARVKRGLIDPGEDSLFRFGDDFWQRFFAAYMVYAESQGMKFVSWTYNSKRYEFPLEAPLVEPHIDSSYPIEATAVE